LKGEAAQVREIVGRQLFKVNRKKTALIVIDLQNAFLEPGAAFEIPEGRKAIPNIERMVRGCRKAGTPVIWTQGENSPPYGGLILAKFPVIAKDRVLWNGNRSFDLYSEMLQPLPSEFRLVKRKYDAFYQTDLEMLLRNLGVDTVVITGVDTCICCESTARSAFFRDMKVVFVSDSTASYNRTYHELTLEIIRDNFGRVMTTNEFLGELKKPPAKVLKRK
jgi:nicotinamidase-related amidase